MPHTPFEKLLNNSPFILGEGAVIERLRRNQELELDPDLVNSAFIYDDAKRDLLESIEVDMRVRPTNFKFEVCRSDPGFSLNFRDPEFSTRSVR